MKKYINVILVMILLTLNGNVYLSGKKTDAKIRKPVFAGQFYPSDSVKLRSALSEYLKDAVKREVGKPIALIAPHAGYVYSGQIAADAYNQVKGNKFDVIVILGTNHTKGGFNKISVYPEGGFLTPLGLSKIDDGIASSLLEADDICVFDEEVHEREHSIEVQLPFIQYLFPNSKIVPAVVGSADMDLCTKFGKLLGRVLKGKNALIVASSDLSHYPSYETAEKIDRHTLESIAQMDPYFLSSEMKKQLGKGYEGLLTCACGEGPVIAAMTAAKELGADCGTVVSYANSGSSAVGNRHKVVGYGAFVFSINRDCAGAEAVKKNNRQKGEFGLSDNEKKTLLGLARKSIMQYLHSETAPLPRGLSEALNTKAGAFVTLRKNSELRGCIGYMREDMPLCEVVNSMALQAAFNDRRFYPVIEDEMKDIRIEISVLTPARPVSTAEDIVMGRDGVVLSKGNMHAVFLPQVAEETKWSREEFLENLARKAGLPAGGWKDSKLSTFQAIVFSDSDFK